MFIGEEVLSRPNSMISKNLNNDYVDDSVYIAYGGSGVMVAWEPVELQERVRFSPTALFRRMD